MQRSTLHSSCDGRPTDHMRRLIINRSFKINPKLNRSSFSLSDPSPSTQNNIHRQNKLVFTNQHHSIYPAETLLLSEYHFYCQQQLLYQHDTGKHISYSRQYGLWCRLLLDTFSGRLPEPNPVYTLQGKRQAISFIITPFPIKRYCVRLALKPTCEPFTYIAFG